MDAQPPEDFSALLRMMAELQAEMSRMKAELAKLTKQNSTPKFVSVNNECEYKTQFGTQMQQAVIKLPDITTVELLLPNEESHFYHKCYMCKERFPSSLRQPKQCPRCGSHRWIDGTTKWDRRKARATDAPAS